VQCENVLLEVLDDENKPCQPGETGRVVISSLHNFASPLIRYDVGDYAEVGSPCDCGRGLPVLNRIYGRARNMLIYPDGNTAWPYLGGAGYYKEIAPIHQFQVIQTATDTLEFHLVVEAPLDSQQKKTLISRLHKTLRYPFNIEFHYHGVIKRSAGGKYEDFISRIVSR
jgi:phenylacetate-CoA ligase